MKIKKILKSLIGILKSLIEKRIVRKMHRAEIRKQKDRRRVKIAKTVSLTKEQKKQIDRFYLDNYGKKIGYQWHKIYTAISGKFDYKYFPEYLYTPNFQFLSNDPRYYNGLQDKNILPLIIKGSGLGIKTPKTMFSCSNNIIINENCNQVSKKDMINKLAEYDSFFIKPSVDSCSGVGCEMIINNGDKHSYIETIIKAISSHKKNFTIQKPLKNQSDIEKINPYSVNTFRIITYIVDNEIYTSPIILRVGRNKNFVDNAHAGGFFVAVSDDGVIISDGKTEFNENIPIHPDSHVVLKGYKISNVDKVIKTAKAVAALVPHVGVIDWDILLDEYGDPVVLEANMMYGSIWLIQMSHGKAVFGENTERILSIIKKNKKLY